MSQLTIHEFIEQENIGVERLYIDKFWSNISEDKWLYIGNDMLKWIGYKCENNQYKLKERYVALLSSSFVENEDYRFISASEMRETDVHSRVDMERPIKIDGGNRTKHLIVSPDCFKESLMLMNTQRAKQIRKYYVQIEKVFRKYMKYIEECNKMQLQQTQKELEQAKKSSEAFKMMIIEKASFKCDQYVYVATSRNYSKQNVFKVGMTKSLEKRMTGYQTGRVSDDKFAYVYLLKCVDAKALEQLIFTRLEPFRYEDSRELFQIHFETLKDILSIFETFENESANTINNLLSDYYSTYSDMPIPDFDDLIIPNLDEYLEDKFNITPIDRYKPIVEDKPNPLSLTTEVVNERLSKFGIKLIGEYSGKGETTHQFECLSPLNHKFESNYEYVSSKGRCSYCGNERILDQIPIYEYVDRTYEHIQTYTNFEELKKAKPDLNHKILRNIIREERWLTPHEGHVYSILEPFDNKLDLFKPLTPAESFVISVLGIHYESMRSRITGSVLNFVLALDENRKVAYFAKSAAEMSRHLTQLNSTKPLNRKTISKYLQSGLLYGGYKWINHGTTSYKDYQMIDATTL